MKGLVELLGIGFELFEFEWKRNEPKNWNTLRIDNFRHQAKILLLRTFAELNEQHLLYILK